ncbi:hypothetical protein OUZ56_001951 [Daphnia magna]|uniref:Uncharacterized protein n=1 Tax=Daphnia magna TaxID=35525 RepID=A0ABR0A486_9CRUS|nr:hypothetical protein OUZ56_001951 [Daphnia magna]
MEEGTHPPHPVHPTFAGISTLRSYKRGKKIENGRKQEYGKEKGKLKMLDRRQFGNGASA